MSNNVIRLRVELPGTLRNPRTETPRREPGSVRRTTVIHVQHPDGPGRDMVFACVGRDARTRADGSLEVLDETRLQARLTPRRTLLAVEGGPEALQQLVGRNVMAGFRRVLAATIPADAEAGTVLHQLVDDWTGAGIVSGQAEMDLGDPVLTPEEIDLQSEHAKGSVDICAGWAADALLVASGSDGGAMPVSLGPVATDLNRPDDPDSWPEPQADLQPGDTRRVRRLDLVPEGGGVRLDLHFRDTWGGVDGLTRVVHEYSLAGQVDPATELITSVVPTAHVLPWPECPAAVASALRVVGLPLADLRETVRREFRGTSTCTHLNDVVRSLADLPVLVRQLG